MPNVRDKNKLLVSAWVDRDLHHALQADAKRRGLTATDIIHDLLARHVMGARRVKVKAGRVAHKV